jgi:hypothetical protein
MLYSFFKTTHYSFVAGKAVRVQYHISYTQSYILTWKLSIAVQYTIISQNHFIAKFAFIVLNKFLFK